MQEDPLHATALERACAELNAADETLNKMIVREIAARLCDAVAKDDTTARTLYVAKGGSFATCQWTNSRRRSERSEPVKKRTSLPEHCAGLLSKDQSAWPVEGTTCRTRAAAAVRRLRWQQRHPFANEVRRSSTVCGRDD